MKKSIIVGMLVLASCGPSESVDPYHPTRPSDIPGTTCDGTPIEWTWEKQRAYNEGRLFLERDSTGCVILVLRKIK